jgi:hypothetical protein
MILDANIVYSKILRADTEFCRLYVAGIFLGQYRVIECHYQLVSAYLSSFMDVCEGTVNFNQRLYALEGLSCKKY